MSDLDIADLRQRVERTPSDDDNLQAIPKSVLLALIDRIESLEAGARKAWAEVREQDDRATEAEARLARVTDDMDCDESWEGGQPNGIGTIEPSDYREWYTPERESHRRRVVTFIGPWEPIRAVAADEQEADSGPA